MFKFLIYGFILGYSLVFILQRYLFFRKTRKHLDEVVKSDIDTRNPEDIYLFKVRDYTTILVGRYENGKYYVQRGDGTKYEYDECRVVWSKKVNEC